MRTSPYLVWMDPEVLIPVEDASCLFTLEALVLERAIIQDNFLISQRFRSIAEGSTSGAVQHLFRSGIASVALRDGTANLEHLKEEIARQIKDGTKVHFTTEPDGDSLYRDRAFTKFLRSVDAAISKSGVKPLPWTPRHLGGRFRSSMYESATEGRSGLPPKTAMEAFHAIDDRLKHLPEDERSHSRTDYYSLAAAKQNRRLARAIEDWASTEYHCNLPNYLNVGVSTIRQAMPRKTQRVALSALAGGDLRTQLVRKCAETVLLNKQLLTDITPDGVDRIRELPQRQALTGALSVNDATGAAEAWTALNLTVASFADQLIPRGKRAKLKRNLAVTGKATVSVTGQGVVLLTLAAAPHLALALEVLSLVLPFVSGSQRRYETTSQAIRSELIAGQRLPLPKYLPEVVA